MPIHSLATHRPLTKQLQLVLTFNYSVTHAHTRNLRCRFNFQILLIPKTKNDQARTLSRWKAMVVLGVSVTFISSTTEDGRERRESASVRGDFWRQNLQLPPETRRFL